jgi:ribose transport system permease protein
MVCAAVCYLALHRMGFGRYVRAIGVKPGVAWYSGIRVPFTLAQVYVGAAFLAGVADILLSANVRSYVRCPERPSPGRDRRDFHRNGEARPSALGTILGVVLLALVKSGLLIIGWNFYWQHVGIGLLVFLVLAVSFGLRRKRS